MIDNKKEFVFNLDVWLLAKSMTEAQELADAITKDVFHREEVTAAERERVEEL